MLKPLHFQVRKKRLRNYGFFLFLLVSLFSLFSAKAKTHGYAAITPDKDDYFSGQVALVPGAAWTQFHRFRLALKKNRIVFHILTSLF